MERKQEEAGSLEKGNIPEVGKEQEADKGTGKGNHTAVPRYPQTSPSLSN